MTKKEYNFKPINVKYVGRTHLACLNCRVQKIKCSGGM